MGRSGVWSRVLALTALTCVPQDRAPDLFARSWLGEQFPELETEGGTWLGAEAPVRLHAARGRPLLVLFTVLW